MAEKTIQDIPRAVREPFERGMAAYHKDNLDYAITLFTSVLQKEPAFYECREALRAAQYRRRSGGGGLLRRLLGQASPLLAKGQLAARSNPAEAMHCAEQVLNEDPRNTGAHELLARAAMAADLPRTAVLSLEILFKASPGDREIGMKLAEALIAAGQSDRADRIYADLLAANPADLEVARAYRDLGARRTLSHKGYAAIASGEGSYRDALRDPAEAVALEQEQRTVRAEDESGRLLEEYRARVAREPGNLKLLRSLAGVLAERKEFAEALAVYEQVGAAEGRTDPSLQKEISLVKLRALEHQLATLDPAAPDYEARRTALEQEQAEFELRDCRVRAEQFPTDLGIRFELGRLYFKSGKIPEAIQELQKAQANPNRRISAMGLLAKCFARRGMYDLAARTLQNALREKPALDEEKKDLLYELGCVLEKMGKPEESVDAFKQIYESDIGFRDVAARVDAYYAARAQ